MSAVLGELENSTHFSLHRATREAACAPHEKQSPRAACVGRRAASAYGMQRKEHLNGIPTSRDSATGEVIYFTHHYFFKIDFFSFLQDKTLASLCPHFTL